MRTNHQTCNRFAGSAVVISATYEAHATTLRLQTYAGERIGHTFEVRPDAAGAAALTAGNERPVSVKIPVNGEPCSVFVLSPKGPHHAEVTLGAALALHQLGIHAVVEGGLRLGVSCSTTTREQDASGPDPGLARNFREPWVQPDVEEGLQLLIRGGNIRRDSGTARARPLEADQM